MSSNLLIDGKHPKKIVIDYYDELINQVDIYAENILENIDKNAKNGVRMETIIKELKDSLNEEEIPDLYYTPILKQFEDPYSSKYTFENDSTIETNQEDLPIEKIVHLKRMQAIEVMKQLQKERLDEIKSTLVASTSVSEAIFGKQFCFLVKIDQENNEIKMKIDQENYNFKLLTIVVDFNLDKNEIYVINYLLNNDKEIDERRFTPNELFRFKQYYSVNDKTLDEKFVQMRLLVKYVKDKLKVSRRNNSTESVLKITKQKLYAIEKIRLSLTYINKVALNRSFDLTRIKSLELFHVDNRIRCGHNCRQSEYETVDVKLDLSGLTSLECLSLQGYFIDFEQPYPFGKEIAVNLRQLKLNKCNFQNSEFLTNMPMLQVLEISYCFDFKLLPSFVNLNLTCLSLVCKEAIDGRSLAHYLSKMFNLVALKLEFGACWNLEENTFKELKKLEVLKLTAVDNGGKWIDYLTNVRDLVLDYVDLNMSDFDLICHILTNLENLEINRVGLNVALVVNRGQFKRLKRLKSLRLIDIAIERIEEDAFLNSSNVLTEIKISHVNSHLVSNCFKGLTNVRRLELKLRQATLESGLFRNLSELTCLRLFVWGVKVIEEGAFEGLNKLSELSISAGWNLLSLNAGTFKGLKDLRSLEIVDCVLVSKLVEDIFGDLVNLRELSLRGNGLAVLEESWFNGLGNVRVLDLSYNRLRVLDLRLLDVMVNVVKLKMNKLERLYFRGFNNFQLLRDKLFDLNIQLIND